jgi:hypothetical protein
MITRDDICDLAGTIARGGPEPLAGCSGLRRAGPIQGCARGVCEIPDPLGSKAHDVATRGAQEAALQLRAFKEAAKL